MTELIDIILDNKRLNKESLNFIGSSTALPGWLLSETDMPSLPYDCGHCNISNSYNFYFEVMWVKKNRFEVSKLCFWDLFNNQTNKHIMITNPEYYNNIKQIILNKKYDKICDTCYIKKLRQNLFWLRIIMKDFPEEMIRHTSLYML